MTVSPSSDKNQPPVPNGGRTGSRSGEGGESVQLPVRPEIPEDPEVSLWRASLEGWGPTGRLCLLYLMRALPVLAIAWMASILWVILTR